MAILVACATLPYLNILRNGFVYDDDDQVLANPYILNFRHLKEIFTTTVWSFRGVHSLTNYYRPMMMMGYLLCNRVFGLRAYGFHLVSLLLHILIVVLVFLLAERVTGDRVGAFVAGALFALHPVHTESVAWIAAVTDVELTFFYLIAFGLFLAVARPGGRSSTPMLTAMVLTFVLALLSKEQAVTLPALATVYEHFYRRDRSETSPSQKLARYGPLWIVAGLYLFFRVRVLGGLAPHTQFLELTPQQLVFSASALVGQYVWKLLWPVKLCAFYVFHPSNTVFDPRVLAGLAVLVALAALFWICWRSLNRNVRFASFGILWFLATLVPVLDARLVGANVFTERYLYLPSVGIAWLAGVGASKLWSRAASRPPERRALALAGVVLSALFAARVVVRDRDWNNDVVLFSRTLDYSPDAVIILDDLGAVYWEQGQGAKAQSLWRRALALDPADTSLLNNMGQVAAKSGRYPEAIPYFRRAIELKPKREEPYLNLGKVYRVLNQTGPAESEFREAIALAPVDYRPHYELGHLLLDEGRVDEAEAELRASVSALPNALAYDFLGEIEIRRGAFEDAAHDFQAALSLDGSDSNAHYGLGYVYQLQGRKADALSEYQAALAHDPSNAGARAAIRALQQVSAGDSRR